MIHSFFEHINSFMDIHSELFLLLMFFLLKRGGGWRRGWGVGGGLNTAHKLFKFLSVTFSHEKSHAHLISLKREYHENTLVFFLSYTPFV